MIGKQKEESLATPLPKCISEDGDLPFNAATRIDYEKQEINFTYPVMPSKERLEKMKNWAYFSNAAFILPGAIIGLLGAIALMSTMSIEEYLTNPGWALIMGVTAFCIYCTGFIGAGYLSIFVHRLSGRARKHFPETNAILHKKFAKKREIQPSDKYSMGHVLMGKKLFIMDYNVVFFKYNATGDFADIKTMETMFLPEKEKSMKDPLNCDYIMKVVFKQAPKKGSFQYWR